MLGSMLGAAYTVHQAPAEGRLQPWICQTRLVQSASRRKLQLEQGRPPTCWHHAADSAILRQRVQSDEDPPTMTTAQCEG